VCVIVCVCVSTLVLTTVAASITLSLSLSSSLADFLINTSEYKIVQLERYRPHHVIYSVISKWPINISKKILGRLILCDADILKACKYSYIREETSVDAVTDRLNDALAQNIDPPTPFRRESRYFIFIFQ
jgi:hypothetical protein